jgi:hypothetical protein
MPRSTGRTSFPTWRWDASPPEASSRRRPWWTGSWPSRGQGGTSTSGLSVNDAAHLYHKALLFEIESGRHARVGDALLAAQSAYADSGAMPELLSIYHFFGDPALKIR